MKPDVKKLVILNLPYLIFVYLFGKCGQAYRLAAGADLSGKLLHFAGGFTAAFADPLPSLHLFDFCLRRCRRCFDRAAGGVLQGQERQKVP